MTGKICLLVASFALAAAVALGAFGAHAMKSRLAPDMLAVYQTAVQYHFWHALGLFALALLMLQWDAPLLNLAGWLLLAGLILFCGSLYLLALTGARWLGAPGTTPCAPSDPASGHVRTGCPHRSAKHSRWTGAPRSARCRFRRAHCLMRGRCPPPCGRRALMGQGRRRAPQRSPRTSFRWGSWASPGSAGSSRASRSPPRCC